MDFDLVDMAVGKSTYDKEWELINYFISKRQGTSNCLVKGIISSQWELPRMWVPPPNQQPLRAKSMPRPSSSSNPMKISSLRTKLGWFTNLASFSPSPHASLSCLHGPSSVVAVGAGVAELSWWLIVISFGNLGTRNVSPLMVPPTGVGFLWAENLLGLDMPARALRRVGWLWQCSPVYVTMNIPGSEQLCSTCFLARHPFELLHL